MTTIDDTTLTFERLLPGDGDDALHRLLRGELWYSRGTAASHEPLRELLVETDLPGFAEREDATVRALGVSPDGTPRGVAVSSAADFERRCQEGLSMFIDKLSALIPELEGLERSAETALGVPHGSCQVKASVSAAGSGLPLHFDQFDTFQFQLKGSKTWLVAENCHARFPLHPYMVGMEPGSELGAYLSRPLTELPRGRPMQLQAGDFLFVPKGHWHATSAAAQASLSIVVRCAAPAWVQLLAPELQAQLIGDVRWREPAAGAWGTAGRAAAAQRRLASLLEDSLPDLGLDARRLIEAYSAPVIAGGPTLQRAGG